MSCHSPTPAADFGETCGRSFRRMSCLLGWRTSGAMDGLADSLVGAAAADVAAHGIVDVGVGGLGFFREQRDRGHNLARLAIAALRNLFLHPALLHLMAAIGGQAFNGRNFLTPNAGDWRSLELS